MKRPNFKFLRKLWPILLALLLAGFTALADVRLPEQLTVIEAEAFLNNTHLTGPLVIPPSVRVIGPRAFEGCIGLTGALVIPEGVTTIDSRAFANCTGFFGEVYIPASVTYLAEDAFDGTDVTLRFASISTDTDLPATGTDVPVTGTDLAAGFMN